MSKENKNIESITPALIEAYKEGRLNQEETYALEKLMLEDPLYAEAFEGFDDLSNEDMASDIEDLNQRLDKAIHDEEKVGFWNLWKVAAIILVIASSVFIIRYQNQSPLPTRELTQNEENEPAKDGLSIDTISGKILKDTLQLKQEVENEMLVDIADEEDIEINLDIDISGASDLEKTTLAEIAESIKTDTAEIIVPMLLLEEAAEPVSIEAKSRTNSRALKESQIKEEIASPPPALDISQSLMASSSTNEESLNVKGRVTESDDGLALPQVTVLVNGTTYGTSTDINGKYELNNIPMNSVISFRYLGYLSQEVSLNRKDSVVNLQLEPDNTSLEEVVVSGLNRSEVKTSSKVKAAKPTLGYPKYNRYLRENLQYPQLAEENKIKGKVTLEFTIERDGSITDIKVIKGLGYGCDEEAIRLIKEGPEWTPKVVGAEQMPEASSIKIKIRFRP